MGALPGHLRAPRARAEHQRRGVRDDLPHGAGTTPFLPIPTIAGSFRFGAAKQFAAALGVYAPDAALLSYPATISDVVPAPQRYSLISLSGSILAVIGGWFAYKPIESDPDRRRRPDAHGILQDDHRSERVPSGQPRVRAGGPELRGVHLAQRGADLRAERERRRHVGAHITWSAIGVSGQAPFVIDAPTTVNVRLPSAAEFDSASQHGTSAHLHLELPPVLRAGVELRPLDNDDLRIELAYVREFWSVEKSLDITPDRTSSSTTSRGSRARSTSTPSRFRERMKDSDSVRLGFEYRLPIAGRRLVARAGVSYETSAMPAAYVSPLTIDNGKVAASIGGSIVLSEHLRLDGVLSHTFQGDVQVAAADARIPISNPVNGNPVRQDYVNGGTYHVNLWVLGVGLEYRF